MIQCSATFLQVVKLCRTHHLYSALTYVLTRGLRDYIAPAVELLLALACAPGTAAVADAGSSLDSGLVASPEQRAAGFKLLVYLRCCLRQQQFPPGAGPLPVGKAGVIKAGVLGESLANILCSAVHHVMSCPPPNDNAADVAGRTHTRLTPLADDHGAHPHIGAGMLLYATPGTMLQLWRSLGGSAAGISPEQLQQALPGAATLMSGGLVRPLAANSDQVAAALCGASSHRTAGP